MVMPAAVDEHHSTSMAFLAEICV